MTPRIRSRPLRVGPIVATLAVVAGCGDEPTSAEAFRNLEIAVESLDGRTVELEEGRAALPEEGLELTLDELHLSGSVESVEDEVTVGFLHTTRGTAFSDLELVVAGRDESGMRHLDSFFLGGPYRAEGIRYEGEEIVVYLLDYAADDPPCCPSISFQRRFHLVDGEVREVEVVDVEEPASETIEPEAPV